MKTKVNKIRVFYFFKYWLNKCVTLGKNMTNHSFKSPRLALSKVVLGLTGVLKNVFFKHTSHSDFSEGLKLLLE